jgi:hypothetical protein
MKLTAETFEELVSSLRSQHTVDKADRKNARVGMHASAPMIAVDEAGVPPQRHTVNIRDLSVEGINILHNLPKRQGRPFVIELARMFGNPLKVLCIVRHCRMVASSPALYSIGAIFRREVAAEQVKQSLAAH